MNFPARYVRNPSKTIKRTNAKGCPCCGCFADAKPCTAFACKACGTSVCESQVSMNGRCPACSFGLVAGWEKVEPTCDYAGCTEHAVAGTQGVGGIDRVCQKHLSRPKINVPWLTNPVALSEYINREISKRDAHFTLKTP